MNTRLETICVRLTTRCDLRCQHCWAPKGGRPLDLPSQEILDFLNALKSIGLRHVSLSGGEPTQYGPLEPLVTELLARGYSVSLATNGTYPERLVDLIRRLGDGVSEIEVRVSVDGWEELHDRLRGTGSFEKATACASRIAAVLGRIAVNTVVFSEPSRAEETVRRLPTEAITDWALMTPVARFTPEPEHAAVLGNIALWRDVLTRSLPHLRVGVWDYLSHPAGGVVVEADGTVKMPAVLERDDVVLGHINEVSPELIQSHIAKRLQVDPVAYFLLPR